MQVEVRIWIQLAFETVVTFLESNPICSTLQRCLGVVVDLQQTKTLHLDKDGEG